MVKVQVPVPDPNYGEVFYNDDTIQIVLCPDCEYGAWTVSLAIQLGEETKLIVGDDPRLLTLTLPTPVREIRNAFFPKGAGPVLVLENGEEVEMGFTPDESLWEKERAFIESLSENEEEELDMEALDMANDVMPPEDDSCPDDPYDEGVRI